MPASASELARQLADVAEDVCRHYLPAGRREGRYWLVGDVGNTPGRSLYVRLRGSPCAPPGKWRDAATGERGDLLDLIAARQGLHDLADVIDEARRFLSLPQPDRSPSPDPAPSGSPKAARRLFAASHPIRGTLAETYLRSRGLTDLSAPRWLRFHPRCWYRGDPDDPRDAGRDAWPALIAAVTNDAGEITGVQRTWLDPSGAAKAPVSSPRRSLGLISGHGVRVGRAAAVMGVGEGLETMLSLRLALPSLSVISAGSAAHLEALRWPAAVRRLYIAEDADPAGRRAGAAIVSRARAAGVDACPLVPLLKDFNDDLSLIGLADTRAALRPQLAPEDVARFGLAAAG